ncbi:PIG-L family deacetylase [Micromonosporaceae bacterium Da 78-11]
MAVVTGAGIGVDRWLARPPSGGDDPAVPVSSIQLQIIAHPDDDLFFFTPDMFRAIDAGAQLITVCLTGGAGDGKNVLEDDPAVATTPADRSAYVAARYNGLRAAYARRAVGDAGSPWDREPLSMAGGRIAELCTLRADPRIKLILLNMWQYGSDGGEVRLRTLWTGETKSQPILTVPGSVAIGDRPYTREGLLAALVDLLERYQPTAVRTMDPDPAYLKHDDEHPQYSDFRDYADHIDHTPVGLFAWAALQQWCARGVRRVVVETYRGYGNRRWPVNLSRSETEEKLSYLSTYGDGDGRSCDDPVGCGDRKVGHLTSLIGYGQGTHHRYSVAATWLRRSGDGQLMAFAVLGGQAAIWTGRGGSWQGPDLIDGRGLVPYLAAEQASDGRWHLFGIRMVPAALDRAQRRDLVTCTQREPGGSFGPWTSLGNPADRPGAAPIQRRGIGMPAVTADRNGRLQVFVRNYFGGVSARAQNAEGGWTSWADLRGSHTQEGLAVVTTKGGRVELFASAEDGIMHWLEREPGVGEFKRDVLPVPAPAGPPSVARLPDGRLALLVRQGHTSNVLAYLQQGAKRRWSTEPIDLGGHGGFGPVACTAYGDDMLAVSQRNDDGTTSLTLRYVDALADGHWKRTGPQLVHTPAIAVDGDGLLTLTAMGADGRLRIARQQEIGATMALRPWQVAGA